MKALLCRMLAFCSNYIQNNFTVLVIHVRLFLLSIIMHRVIMHGTVLIEKSGEETIYLSQTLNKLDDRI